MAKNKIKITTDNGALVEANAPVIEANASSFYPFLDANITFCKKPLPWSRGAKDHRDGSWWHNFQLVRFGGRRQVAISQETGLDFSSMLRMTNR